MKDRVQMRLDAWKAPPTLSTIRNVVIVSHWLDIPYVTATTKQTVLLKGLGTKP